ncbi:AAA family ATPase [Sinomicrobium sp. M5D2P9]
MRLKSFHFRNYKSFGGLVTFTPGDITLLTGATGSGKSNVMSFPCFLRKMLYADGRLQEYVAYEGGAIAILYQGTSSINAMDAFLEIETDHGNYEYAFSLAPVRPNKLVFQKEQYRFTKKTSVKKGTWSFCGEGHEEAEITRRTSKAAMSILQELRKLEVYNFHQTATTAAIRLKWSLADGRRLKNNGENLGSFLYRLYKEDKTYYQKIVKCLQLQLPFFKDFYWREAYDQILLQWKEKGKDAVFHAGQASDGMLRLMALTALLMQNPKDLPAVLFLEEPDCGLGPETILPLAEMIRDAAARGCQVIMTTRSEAIIQYFSQETVIAVERGKAHNTIHLRCRDGIY